MMSSLPSLPPDALVAVLCRCPAADHPALRRTCRALRSALDSDPYRSERATSGWAEVTTRLVSGEEMYDRDNPDGPMYLSDPEEGETVEEKKRRRRQEDIEEHYTALGHKDEYDVVNIRQDIEVDGVMAGSISMVLVPREWGVELFHDATDAHSRELCEVGWGLCDIAGRPKVKSIRDADLSGWGEANEGGFLHVETVRVHHAYRAGDCTNVVAQAVRSALLAPELFEEWTLSTGISDYNVYMSREEKRLYEDGDRPSEAVDRAIVRAKECRVLDARTYLRAGYRQIPEVVGAEQNKPVWLFALPAFLEKSLLTAAEADAIQLHEPPELPPKPCGVDDELHMLIKTSSNSLRIKMDALKQSERLLADKRQQTRSVLEEREAEVAESRNLLGAEGIEQLLGERYEVFSAGVREMETRLEAARSQLEETLRDAEEESSRERREIAEQRNVTILETRKLVNERGASVRKSFAIHCASANRIPEYVDCLLELVPPQQRAAAISEWDDNGNTVLHSAFMSTPELFNADEYRTFALHLLDLGADTDARNASNMTALGQHREVLSGRLSFASVFFATRTDDGPEAWRGYHQKMEETLRPTRGETDADRGAMPSAYATPSAFGVALHGNEEGGDLDDDDGADMDEQEDDEMEDDNNEDGDT